MDRYTNLADGQLITLVLEGDPDAVTHLLGIRCGAGLKYLAQSKYRTLGLDVHELVSEVYLILRNNDWKALRDFRGANQDGTSCKLTHYIFCIAARWLSRKMSRAVKESTWTLPLEEMDADQIGSVQADTPVLTAGELMDAVLALPDPVDRAVLMLYKIEGKDVDVVAKLLQTTPGNVYTRCSRAIRTLRQHFRVEERV